jgi:DNA-3-methyladenine glycosylase
MGLERSFFERDTITVAKELLGKFLVHETKEGRTVGEIVETEAYIGPDDRASHAFNNLRTKRTEIQFGPKGHAYIYLVYGMNYCFNVTSGDVSGKPEAILVRSLEPIEGIEIMAKRRKIAEYQIKDLANGPGKLCTALAITKEHNGIDLCNSPLFIEKGVKVDENKICQTKRIGVDYAREWKHMPWRFFIKENDFVSIKKVV